MEQQTAQQSTTDEFDMYAIVARLEEIVYLALECENKPLKEGVSMGEILKQLKEISHSVEHFADQQAKFADNLKRLSDESGIPLETNSLPNEKIVAKIGTLQRLCTDAEDRLHSLFEANPDAFATVQEQLQQATLSDKKKVARRKNKFSALGAKSGWLPT